MKKLITVFALSLISTSSHAADLCTYDCQETGRPGLAALVGVGAGSFIFGNSRSYETWVRTCAVRSPSGEVVYRDKISGAAVTQVRSIKMGATHAPGDKLDKKRDRREEKQDGRVSAALEACNQEHAAQ